MMMIRTLCLSVLVSALCVQYTLAGIDTKCLKCICQVESNCRDVGCIMDGGSLSCGYYQIKYPYYIDCGQPGSDWQSCASSLTCAETCVRRYMDRYGTYCTGGRTPTCQDYARIHNGGPHGCQKSSTLYHWTKVKACLDRS